MLAAAYGRYGWGEEALAGYLLALSDIDIALLRKASAHALRTGQSRMPTPGELRRLALQVITGPIPVADEAWGEVQLAIRRHGRCRRPDWSHPLIGRVIAEIGGWRRVCDSDDPTGDRIAFRKAYDAVTTRAEHEALTTPGLAPQALTAAAQASLAIAPPLLELRQLPSGHFYAEPARDEERP